jgi:hypothetical protein
LNRNTKAAQDGWRGTSRQLKTVGEEHQGSSRNRRQRMISLLEKPVTDLLKNVQTFYGNRKFITIFISFLCWFLS